MSHTRVTDESQPTSANDHENRTVSTPIITVNGLTKKSDDGFVYRDVSFTADEGDMTVLEGPEGSGKTMLLLGLVGRMAFDSGSVQLDGLALPPQARKVRDHTSVANVAVLTGLDPGMTVRQHIAERLIMNGPWYRTMVRKSTVNTSLERITDIIAAVHARIAQLPDAAREKLGLDARSAPTLPPDMFVDALDDLQSLMLEVILAALSPATIIAVDDVDALRTRADRMWAWLLLLQLSHARREVGIDNTTILTTSQETAELTQLLDILDDVRPHHKAFAPVTHVQLTSEER